MLPYFGMMLASSADGQFQPHMITGLVGWFDANDPASITHVAGAVSTWTNKAGGASATQSTAAYKPTYGASGFDGVRPAITFDGSNDYLSIASALAASDQTIFAAYKQTANAPAIAGTSDWPNAARIWGDDEAGFQDDFGFGVAYDGAVNRQIYGTGTSGVGDYGFYHTTAIGTSAHIGGATRTSSTGSVTQYLDGGTGVSSGLSSGTRSAVATTAISRGATHFTGPIAELIIYNRVLTTGERQQIEGYLAARWGLQANLPAGHPYRYRVP